MCWNTKQYLKNILKGALALGIGAAVVAGALSGANTDAMAADAAFGANYEAAAENGVKVLVDAPKGALPEGAELHAELVVSEKDTQAVADELDKAEVSYDGFLALDVFFADADGNEVEPAEAVDVRFELPEGALPEGAENLAVHHLSEAEDGTVADVEVVADGADETEGTVEQAADPAEGEPAAVAEFSVGSFSWFTLTYTDPKTQVSGESIHVYLVDEEGEELPGEEIDFSDLSGTYSPTDFGEKWLTNQWVSVEKLTDTWAAKTEGYEFVGAYADARLNTRLAWIRYNTTGGGGWRYRSGSDGNGSSLHDLYLVFHEVVSSAETNVTIIDSVAENGKLTASYTGEGNPFYVWQKFVNGQWQTIDQLRVNGDQYLYDDEDQNSLNVVLEVVNDGADEGGSWYRVSAYSSREAYESSPESPLDTSAAMRLDYYDQLQNGDFETPNVDELSDGGKNNYQYPVGTKDLVWGTTGSDQQIEIVNSIGNRDSSDYKNNDGAQSGVQYAELNCQAAGALYQDVLTVPGTELNWQFYHRGRGGNDTMYLVIAPSNLVAAITTQDQLMGLIRNIQQDPDGYAEQGYYLYEATDSNAAWGRYSSNSQGASPYTVPNDQYLTRFFFVAGSTAASLTEGNLLDNVRFTTELLPAQQGEANLTITKVVTGVAADDADALSDYTVTVNVDGKTVTLDGFSQRSGDSWYATGHTTVDGITANGAKTVTVTESAGHLAGYVSDGSTVSVNGSAATEGTSAEVTLQDRGSGTVAFTNAYENFAPEASKRIGYDGSDEYTLALDVIGRSTSATVTSGKPLDVVMIIDRSTSMNDAMSGADQYVKVGVSDVVESSGHFEQGLTGTIAYQDTHGGEYYAKNSQGGYDRIYEVTQRHVGTAWFVGGSYEEHVSWSLNDRPVDPGTTDFYEKREGGTTTRLQALKDAANDFVDSAAALGNADQVRIGIVSFAGENEHDQGASSIDREMLELTAENVGSLHTTINGYNPGSGQGTYPEQAFVDAATLLGASQDGTQKVVIFFTDGGPGGGSYGSSSWDIENEVAEGAIEAAKQVKDLGVTIFSVGVMDDADVTKGVGGANANASETERINAYMHAVSSNYPAAMGFTPSEIGNGGDNGYYKATTNANELQEIFEDIFSQTTATAQYRGVTIHDELSQYATAKDFIKYDDAVGPDGFGKVMGGAYLTVSRVERDESGNVTSEEAVGTTEEGYPRRGVDYDIWYNPQAEVIELRFSEDYALLANWKYTLVFKVKPTKAAYDAYAADNTYGGNTGDAGTDLYTATSHPTSGDYVLNTSDGKPGFDSNTYAYVSYRDGDETLKTEYPVPVLQVTHLEITGGLQVTKKLDGKALEADEFSFEVTTEATGEGGLAVSMEDAARRAGFIDAEGNPIDGTSDGKYTFNNENGAGAGVAGVARTAGKLTFTSADVGKTFVYDYREVDTGEASYEYDATEYQVRLTVAWANDAHTALKVEGQLLTREGSEGEFGDARSFIFQGSADDPSVAVVTNESIVTVPFENVYGVYSLVIFKGELATDENGNLQVDPETGEPYFEPGKGLNGAEFQLYGNYSKEDGCTNPIEGKFGVTANDAAGSAGYLVIEGVTPGIYYLKEEVVPSGYQILPEPIRIIVNPNGTATYTMLGGYEGYEGEVEKTVNAKEGAFRIEIGNKPNPDLPSSGSSGAIVVMATGVTAMTLGGAYLTRKRMNPEA